jgi:glycosyltransferase involved in cell wall biosynthesis
MKICIITGYFHPEITAETHLLLDLTKDFAKYGAEVLVVTSFPSRGIDVRTRREYFKIPKEITCDGVKVFRVGLKSPEGNRFILRTMHYLLTSYAIYQKAKTIKPDVYLISSTPPFLGIVGALLSKIAPTVYNLQDLFPDSLIFTKKSTKKSLVIKLFKKVERLIYKKNTHILTISEDFKKNILAKGVPEEKISIVYNWIDTNAVIPVKKPDNELFIKYSLNPNAFYVTYCGNIGHSQNLEMVIDVAKRLENSYPDIKFIIIGDGAWLKKIIEYVKAKKSRNVVILPYQPYEMISSVFSLGDVSLVCSKKGVSIGSVPSKTWSIMSAARAVLCSFDEDSELTTIIRRANCGICIPPEDDRRFENALLIFYNNIKMTLEYGLNGREFIKKNLTREDCTLKYFNILNRFT